MKRVIMSYLNSKPCMRICWAVLVASVGFVNLSCENNKSDALTNEVKTFMAKQIEMPISVMDKRDCAMFKDTLSNQCVCMVKFFDSISCSSCLYSNLANHEAENLKKNKNVEFIYVISTPKDKKEEIYRGLCSKRVKGTVYLDTCNAFLKANPHIPESELFHTFVINNQGKVLMVGDPFKNEKMEALLKKVIANEQKTKK